MKVSFTGLANPHIYIGKEQFVPVRLTSAGGYSVETYAKYIPAKFTCELTNDENGNHFNRFKATTKLLRLDKYMDKENAQKISATVGFYNILNSNNHFCKFSLNGQDINNRKSVDLHVLNKLSEYTKTLGKDKNLSENQRGYFNAMSLAYDEEVDKYRPKFDFEV